MAARPRLLPDARVSGGARLDVPGATLLFLGLVCLIVPILAARELGGPLLLAGIEIVGILLTLGFMRVQRIVQARGDAPLVDLTLLTQAGFRRRLAATALLFAGNLSFYLVVTLFLQDGLGMTPFRAGLAMLPLIAAFILGSRQGAAAVARDGGTALARGALLMAAGIGVFLASVAAIVRPPMTALALPLALYGYGQGRVMAPLFGVVLAAVRPEHAGAGSGILATTQQIANGVGVAVLGTVYLAMRECASDRAAVMVALAVVGVSSLATACLLRSSGPGSGRPRARSGFSGFPGAPDHPQTTTRVVFDRSPLSPQIARATIMSVPTACRPK